VTRLHFGSQGDSMTGYRGGGRVPRVLLVSFQSLHNFMEIETRVIFLMDRVAWGSASGFPCHCNSTIAPVSVTL